MNSSKKTSTNFKKRAPPRIYTRKNDVYVTNKTDFRATLKKCQVLLNSEEGECFLHCIGNAINRGINLALKLSEEHNYKFEANTSTINLVGKRKMIQNVPFNQELLLQTISIHWTMKTISSLESEWTLACTFESFVHSWSKQLQLIKI